MEDKETSVVKKLDVDRLQHLLETSYFGIGKRLIYTPIVDSTNTLAMKLAQDGSEEGAVVLTDSQTAGKGRQGRRWVDVTGKNVLLSTVLRPLFSPHLLIMAASLAVIHAIADISTIEVTIKWPNDILIQDGKVAGILIETRSDPKGQLIAIVGMGVNVNGKMPQILGNEADPQQRQSGHTYRAITLEEASGHQVEREIFIAQLLKHLESFYTALQQEARGSPSSIHGPISRLIREEWSHRLSTLGHTVQVRQGNTRLSGVAEDVNENGELLLRDHSGQRICITWGDVDVLPEH